MIKFQNISKVLFVYVYPLVDTSKFQIIKSTKLNIFFFFFWPKTKLVFSAHTNVLSLCKTSSIYKCEI